MVDSTLTLRLVRSSRQPSRHPIANILKGPTTMKRSEPGLLQGFFLCLRDSEAIRLQSSKWKRNLLIFSSGICLEVAAVPYLLGWIGYEATWQAWLLTWLFFPLGITGAYASIFGGDRLVEWLLIVPKLDLKI
jgi:hypothetical protein